MRQVRHPPLLLHPSLSDAGEGGEASVEATLLLAHAPRPAAEAAGGGGGGGSHGRTLSMLGREGSVPAALHMAAASGSPAGGRRASGTPQRPAGQDREGTVGQRGGPAAAGSASTARGSALPVAAAAAAGAPVTVSPARSAATSAAGGGGGGTGFGREARWSTTSSVLLPPALHLRGSATGSSPGSYWTARAGSPLLAPQGGPRVDPATGAPLPWDVELVLAGGGGTGVLATERAGHTFGTLAQGVRGKAGTPGFWAPEMLLYDADGRGARYGPAADWWSFGCLLYAMMSARGPFSVVGGDTADDNDATLHAEPDFSGPLFSAEAIDLLQARKGA